MAKLDYSRVGKPAGASRTPTGTFTLTIPADKATPEVMGLINDILGRVSETDAQQKERVITETLPAEQPAETRASNFNREADPIRRRDTLRGILRPGLPPRRMGD